MHVSSPICTRLGFTEAGIERAHCHHSPVSSGNCLGGKPCADTTFIGSVSPIAIAAIAKKSLVFFTVSSSLSISSLRGLALYRLSLIMWSCYLVRLICSKLRRDNTCDHV